MHINMFTIVWFYSSKTFCEISVPYVLDKSLIKVFTQRSNLIVQGLYKVLKIFMDVCKQRRLNTNQ